MWFGAIMGAVLYIGGNATSNNDETIIKMVGFSPYMSDTETSEETTEESETLGTITTITTTTKDYEYKKDFFTLMEMQNQWSLLYMLQNGLMMTLPYLYMFLIESSIMITYSMFYFNYYL